MFECAVKTTVEKFDFRQNASIILLIYFVTFFIYSDFGIHSFFGVFLLTAYLILEIAQFILIDKKSVFNVFKSKKWNCTIILLVAILFSVLNKFYFDKTEIFYVIIAIISLGIGTFSKNIKDVQMVMLEKIAIVTALIISAIIYAYRICPNIYNMTLLKLLSPESKEYVMRITGEGYCVTVGGEISYTLLLIIIGIIFLMFGGTLKNLFNKLFLFFVMFGAILISQRRTELVFIILTLFVGFFVKYRKYLFCFISKHKKCIICLSIICLIVGICLGGWIWSMPSDYTSKSRIIQTFLDIKNGKDITTGRSALYKVAGELLDENFIRGIGWMNFSKYAILTGNIHARNVHCIYLQLLVENGIFLFVIILFTFIWNLKKVMNNLEKNKNAMIPFTFLVYVFSAGLIDNTIYYPYFWTLYILMLIIAYKEEEEFEFRV